MARPPRPTFHTLEENKNNLFNNSYNKKSTNTPEGIGQPVIIFHTYIYKKMKTKKSSVHSLFEKVSDPAATTQVRGFFGF